MHHFESYDYNKLAFEVLEGSVYKNIVLALLDFCDGQKIRMTNLKKVLK